MPPLAGDASRRREARAPGGRRPPCRSYRSVSICVDGLAYEAGAARAHARDAARSGRPARGAPARVGQARGGVMRAAASCARRRHARDGARDRRRAGGRDAGGLRRRRETRAARGPVAPRTPRRFSGPSRASDT
ncbi:hypothetical protein AQ925_01710 [Burkholderia pseudomallei]|nr:hypothetical protein AQ926_20795 [Burkholderia pseudomallei]ONC99840.1 hypothetical protein AQ925_01710 [Burkholderia pseudomallei]OND15137.1 hypothetical protein AQ928_02260 [Burkholderia pseudomallei]OND17368.1 hypothetical protein AQ927_09705 [Burkholderia pseudomallei]OND30142.1 hypothetical protein AQ930_28030 [Burkholderia pseudomallei]